MQTASLKSHTVYRALFSLQIMKKIIFVLVFLIFLSAGQTFAWEGVVVKVLDGDSLKISRNGKIYEIRLYGIDAPEYRQAYSNKAKRFLKKLAFRQSAEVEQKDIDRYGRLVALVTVQGELVNKELVRSGLAWFYPKYCREQPLCSQMEYLEKEARRGHRGLWRDEDPVSPWEWKRRQRISGSGTRKR